MDKLKQIKREPRGILVTDTPLKREYAIRDGWVQVWTRPDDKAEFAYAGETEVED